MKCRMRTICQRSGLLLGGLVLAGALAEVGARLALRSMEGSDAPIKLGWDAADGKGGGIRDLLYRPDPDLFFRLRPEVHIESSGNPRIFDVHTNALGLRCEAVATPKPAGVYRILAVGDSCTFGSGAAQAETYPAHLEGLLKARRPEQQWEVINAGVPGFSSFQALRYLEREGFDLEPDAVLLASAINDASVAAEGSKRRFGGVRKLSDREYAEALTRTTGLGITRLLARTGLWDPAPPETPRRGPRRSLRRVPIDEYEAGLRDFVQEVRAHGALPVLVAWPLRVQVDPSGLPTSFHRTVEDYQQISAQVAEATGSPFVDLVQVTQGGPELFVDIVHMNGEGYAVVAEAIAACLLAQLPE